MMGRISSEEGTTSSSISTLEALWRGEKTDRGLHQSIRSISIAERTKKKPHQSTDLSAVDTARELPGMELLENGICSARASLFEKREF